MSTARIKVKLETPNVPDFIRSDDGMFDVAQFDDAILRAIGREWTKKLIDNARRRRLAYGVKTLGMLEGSK